jgi:hypothetical protein
MIDKIKKNNEAIVKYQAKLSKIDGSMTDLVGGGRVWKSRRQIMEEIGMIREEILKISKLYKKKEALFSDLDYDENAKHSQFKSTREKLEKSIKKANGTVNFLLAEAKSNEEEMRLKLYKRRTVMSLFPKIVNSVFLKPILPPSDNGVIHDERKLSRYIYKIVIILDGIYLFL